jgi:hypothetical protein
VAETPCDTTTLKIQIARSSPIIENAKGKNNTAQEDTKYLISKEQINTPKLRQEQSAPRERNISRFMV